MPEEAHSGRVRLKAAGATLLLVTGRVIEDLSRIFAHMEVFDMIVAENGGRLYSPKAKVLRCLAEPPPAGFVERMMAHNVGPIEVGHCIVATWEPHQDVVLATIKKLGLALKIIFNKGAVMILPRGVDKASALAAALQQFGLKAAEVVAIGDAENDQVMLEMCGFPMAVANALPGLHKHARYMTTAGRGEGVAELIGMILQPDFSLP